MSFPKIIQNLTSVDNSAVHVTGNETIAGDKSFTGTLTTVTQQPLDSSTKIATTKYVDDAINAISEIQTTNFSTQYSSSRDSDIAVNETFTVPQYTVGLHNVEVFIDGAQSPENDTWMEVGNAGDVSTTIKFLSLIESRRSIYIRVQSALSISTSVSDINYVHKTGTEVVNGAKTFNDNISMTHLTSRDDISSNKIFLTRYDSNNNNYPNAAYIQYNHNTKSIDFVFQE